MAVQWDVENTRGSHYYFPPEAIELRPELNGREVLPDIEWLIESFLQHGQIEDCEVRIEGAKRQPILSMGYSRYRACVEFNTRELYKRPGQSGEPMRLRCVYFRGDEQEAYLRNIAENRDRNDLGPLDYMRHARKLEQWGKSVAEIAVILRQPEPFVRNALSLAEGTVELKRAVQEGRITSVSAAAHIAKLSAEQQRKAVAGDGKVKAPPSDTLGAKALRARIIDAALNDTTQPKAVREFCLELVKQWWPAVIRKAKAEAEEES